MAAMGHAHAARPSAQGMAPATRRPWHVPPGPPNRTPFSDPRAPPWPTAFPAHDDHATCRASGVWSLTHGHIFFKATAPPHAAAPATGHVEYCGLSVVRRPQKPPRFSAMCWLRTPQTRRDEPGDVHEQHWSHRGPHATPRPSVASPTHRQPSHVPAAAATSRPIGRSEAGPRQRERIPWIGAPPLTAASCNAGRAS